MILLTVSLLACSGQRLRVGDDGIGGAPAGRGGGAGAAAGAAGSPIASGTAGIGGAAGGVIARLTILPPIDPTGYQHPDRQYNVAVEALKDDGSVLAGRSELYEPATNLSRSYIFYWTAEAGMVDVQDISTSDSQVAYTITMSPDGSSLLGLLYDTPPPQTDPNTYASAPYTFYRWTEQGGFQIFGAPWPINAQMDFVSPDGSMVVMNDREGGGQSQFFWRQSDGFNAMSSLPGWPDDGYYYSPAGGEPVLSFSDDGSVIAGYHQTSSGTTPPFIWKAPGSVVDLGRLPGAPSCSIDLLSRDGTVAYGRCLPLPSDGGAQQQQTFRWSAATGMVAIGSGTYLDTTRDGAVAMGGNGTDTLFRWTAGSGEVLLKPAPDVIDLAHWRLSMRQGSLSADGTTVYGTLTSTDPQPIPEIVVTESFLWSTTLGFVPSGSTNLQNTYTVTSDPGNGSLPVGVSGQPGPSTHALLWDCQGMRDIVDELTAAGVDLQGVLLDSPLRAWSGDSIMIVGTGTIGNDERTWVAWLPGRCP